MNLDWLLLGLRVAAALILYSFLGLAFYLIWRDLQAVEAQSPPPATELPGLRLIDTGPDNDWIAGQIFPVRPVSFLGRAPESNIVISHPAASARHARLSCANGAWWLEDLNSKNGTTLNGLSLSKPVTLTDGDVIGIGPVQLQFEIAPHQNNTAHVDFDYYSAQQ